MKIKKRLGFFKIETPKIIWIDEYISLRSKAYSFKGNIDDENKNKLKGTQTKNINFREYYKCLFGNEYEKECENYLIRSLNHDIYLPKVTKK